MNTMSRTCSLIALVLFALAFTQSSVAQQASADRTLSPYFFVNGDSAVDRLPLKDTNVEVSVSGVIADVRVTQTYRNEGSRPINASYVFPASTRAAVYAMQMKIRDEITYAKIREREKAKKEFEEAKQQGKSASLLEQERPNVFAMSLANIMPGDDVQIQLRYTELLIPTNGEYEFVYPTVVGPRYSSDKDGGKPGVAVPYLHQGEKPTSTLHIGARISAGMPIRELSCRSHQIAPEFLNQSTAQLALDEPNAFQGNKDFILKYRLTGSQIASGLLLYQGKDENFFLYMAQPPARVAANEIPPREYVFVVDVSGSMEGFPLATAKGLLTKLIAGLKPTDYFNVVLFSGDSTALSPVPLAANQENLGRAISLIDKQRGSGGTELMAAMKQANSLGHQPGTSRSIVLVTDGYISAEKEVFQHIRQNNNNTNVFAFGIGSSVNRYLIEGVARAGMGEPFVVEGEESASEAAEKFRAYIESPVLTDIKLKANGFEVYDTQSMTFPDMFAQRPIVMYGKWRGPVAGSFELTGKTGAGDFHDVTDITAFQPNEADTALRYLWARSRISELSDYSDGEPSEDEIKQVTDLGLQYSLLTKYTSFIAVRERIVNPNGDSEDVTQPIPLPDGVMDTAVGSEPEMVWILASLALVAGLIVMRRKFVLINRLCSLAE